MIGIRTLDRYVFGSWLRIFVLTALGFPLVSILINLTDTLNKLLDRGLTMREIVVSYVYSIPENVFLVMPAAVLFATVFTVGAMGRHSELTAAKAGGMSFHRLVSPIFLAAVLATGLAFVVGEMAPGATARQAEIQKSKQTRSTRSRYNFVYRADAGWVYTVRSLDIGHPAAQAAAARAAGQRGAVPGAHHHGRQRELERHDPALADAAAAPAGSSPGRASRRRSRSAPCGSGRSPSRRPTCWRSRRRRTRCATRSSAGTSTP